MYMALRKCFLRLSRLGHGSSWRRVENQPQKESRSSQVDPLPCSNDCNQEIRRVATETPRTR